MLVTSETINTRGNYGNGISTYHVATMVQDGTPSAAATSSTLLLYHCATYVRSWQNPYVNLVKCVNKRGAICSPNRRNVLTLFLCPIRFFLFRGFSMNDTFSVESFCNPRKLVKGKGKQRKEREALLNDETYMIKTMSDHSNSELFRVRQQLQREKPRHAAIMLASSGRIVKEGEFWTIGEQWEALCVQSPRLSVDCVVCELTASGWMQIDE